MEMPEGWKKLLDCSDKPLRHYGTGYSKEDVDLKEVCALMKEMAEALEAMAKEETSAGCMLSGPHVDSKGNWTTGESNVKRALRLFKEWK